MIGTLVLFASLGLDTLAVSLGLGVAGLPRARWLRVGLTFAAFEGLMPVLGLLIGERLSAAFGDVATYAAASLLVVLGLIEIREAIADDDDAGEAASPLLADGGRALILGGLSVSLDELAVGFTLGVLGVSLGPALAYIAAQAFVLTFVGLRLGRRIGSRLGGRAELVAGIALALLGLALILDHATGRNVL